MTGVVTITQERRRAVGCSPADMYTLALPRQGRAANAGRWTDCRRTCGANSGTGEDDRKCPIHERLPPPIKDVPCWV